MLSLLPLQLKELETFESTEKLLIKLSQKLSDLKFSSQCFSLELTSSRDLTSL